MEEVLPLVLACIHPDSRVLPTPTHRNLLITAGLLEKNGSRKEGKIYDEKALIIYM